MLYAVLLVLIDGGREAVFVEVHFQQFLISIFKGYLNARLWRKYEGNVWFVGRAKKNVAFYLKVLL
jgi:hypothetical protein